jgi:hypothetical protein
MDYSWSSFEGYYLFYNGQQTIIDGAIMNNYFETFEEFNNYMNEINDDECLERQTVKCNNDDTLIEIISKKYKIPYLPQLSIDKKKEIIKDIYKRENTSIRQLSRIFGIGKTVIENTIKKDK